MTRVYIIAEAGVNHNGSMEMARDLINVAASAGADAVKFQTFKTNKLVSYDAPKAPYQIDQTKDSSSQLDMLRKLELTEIQHIELYEYACSLNIDFLSSPFDLESLHFLSSILKLPRIKIASGEITNAPLLFAAAQTGKKIILSTGMSSLGEVEMALGGLAFGYVAGNRKPCPEAFQASVASREGQQVLKEKVTLLHCTSEYPAPFEDVNLLAMDTLKQAFALAVGYSDHTSGISIAIAAAARGAAVIEKHFTLDKDLPGPDHRASLDPDELRAMIASIRQVEQALGSPLKTVSTSELQNRLLVRKSLVASQPIRKGEDFTETNIGIKRPASGMAPIYYWEIIGQKAQRDYETDELVNE